MKEKEILKRLEQTSICLKDRRIIHFDTGARTYSKQRTLHKLTALMGSSKVISKLKEVTHYDRIGIPVFLAIPAPLKSEVLGKSKRIPCHWGKGIDYEQAKISALSETIERYSAKMHGDEGIVTTEYENIQNYSVSPGEFIHLSEEAYERHSSFTRYNDALKLDWIAGFSLITHRFFFVPANFVFFPYVASNGIYLSYSDTYGLGAGNTMEEAILTGILELIEADAVTINFRNKIHAPLVDINSIDDAVVNKLLSKFQENAIQIYIQNVTTDIGIHTFQTLLVDEKKNPSFALGFGASPSPRVAIIRSLVEAAQNRCSQIVFRKLFAEATKKTAYDHILNTSNPTVPFHSFVDLSNKTILGNIRTCLKCLQSAIPNVEVFLINITRKEIAFPVVRVLIPELQPGDFGNSFSTSRLYKVPRILEYEFVS